MIKVCVEVREGASLFRVAVYADSISQAVSIARRRIPGRDMRVVFPIDAEGFFVGRDKENEEGGAKDGSS